MDKLLKNRSSLFIFFRFDRLLRKINFFMNRPFLKYLVQDLESLFDTSDLGIKKEIYKELFFYRKTKVSRNLLKIVEEKIGSTKDGKRWLEKESQKRFTNKSSSNKSKTKKDKIVQESRAKIISIKSKR